MVVIALTEAEAKELRGDISYLQQCGYGDTEEENEQHQRLLRTIELQLPE